MKGIGQGWGRYTGWLLVLGWLVLAATGARAAEERPNVLFIAVDDLNDWISPLDGYEGVETPNLDRLAKRGTVFTRAYCSAPACNPSRASLMCGVRPSTSGVYHNRHPWRKALPDAVTLAQHFGKHGYDVDGCGKIFHGRYPDPPSWDRYFNRPADPYPKKRPVNGIPGTGHFDWGPVAERKEAMGDWKVADWAIERLAEQREQPLFLAAGFFRPHLPWYVPEPYFERYPVEEVLLPKTLATDLEDIPQAGVRIARPEGDHRKVTKHEQWEEAVQGYLASITFADECVGRLLDALDESPAAEDTIIVLWGDHGWHLGEKEHWRKFALWEEATRVPMIWVAPGVTEAGTRCERTVSLLDIYPTLCELCELPKREELEGVSLVPQLKNPEAKRERPVVTTHGRNNHAVRSERWRYIRYADGSEELYDHEADPLEWKNLAQEAKFADVKQELAKWLPEKNAPDAPRDRR